MANEKYQQERKWLGKKEAMRYLCISQRTIENWSAQGLIRTYRMGGKIFIDQNELDEDISGSRKGKK